MLVSSSTRRDHLPKSRQGLQWIWIAPIIGSLIFVLAIISHPVFIMLVSRFNRGQSTRAHRIWMLGWLSTNGLSAGFILVSSEISSMERPASAVSSYLLNMLMPCLGSRVGDMLKLVYPMLMYATYAFAIGGFVTVGKILRAESYQLCNI